MPDTSTDVAAVNFRVLAGRVRAARLLDRRHGYYVVKIAATVGALVGGWLAVAALGNTWAALAMAAFMGAVSAQLAFIGHDAGHQQIFSSRRANRWMGLAVGNALVGLSFGWWVPKHNAHHAHPNELGKDPDIGEGLVLAAPVGGGARSVGLLRRSLARWQAGLFFPLMLLRSTGLHVLGIQRLCQRRDRSAAVEALLISLHAGAYLALVFWFLSPAKAVAFIVVQQAVFSVYLGCSFAPNHKGMPVIEGSAPMGFAARQVVTARNIRGGAATDFVLGGLNRQIEHHLFPSMPRANLRRARPLVQQFCSDSHLPYCEVSAGASLRQIVGHLRNPCPAVAGTASVAGR